MENIASTPKYQIKADADKNRVYIKIVGVWESVNEVPDYIDDWNRAISRMYDGFTILADLREMSEHPDEVMAVHAKAMKLSKNAGCSCSADVVNDDLTEIQMVQLYNVHNADNNKFPSIDLAEQFLDAAASEF